MAAVRLHTSTTLALTNVRSPTLTVAPAHARAPHALALARTRPPALARPRSPALARPRPPARVPAPAHARTRPRARPARAPARYGRHTPATRARGA
ncbi:MAG TPA: hypothetical protein VNO30_26095 [Kofleriaceae bacterium]|nr:hypothetical protein [Kofleriaceae bacterium]